MTGVVDACQPQGRHAAVDKISKTVKHTTHNIEFAE